MSEPHGNCLDSMLTYATTDSGIPLLETVSEDTFRDSFEHSSSESGFTNLTDTRIGMKPLKANGGQALSEGTVPSSGAFVTDSNHHTSTAKVMEENAANSAKSGSGSGSARRLSLVHVFVPSFVTMLILLFVAAIFIIESDPGSFKSVKEWPEMISLRYHYYEPAKNFLTEVLGSGKSKE